MHALACIFRSNQALREFLFVVKPGVAFAELFRRAAAQEGVAQVARGSGRVIDIAV